MKLTELEAKAQAATPGQRLRDGRLVYTSRHAGWGRDGEQFVNDMELSARHEIDAVFAEAATPATVLRLIVLLRQAEALLEEHGNCTALEGGCEICEWLDRIDGDLEDNGK